MRLNQRAFNVRSTMLVHARSIACSIGEHSAKPSRESPSKPPPVWESGLSGTPAKNRIAGWAPSASMPPTIDNLGSTHIRVCPKIIPAREEGVHNKRSPQPRQVEVNQQPKGVAPGRILFPGGGIQDDRREVPAVCAGERRPVTCNGHVEARGIVPAEHMAVRIGGEVARSRIRQGSVPGVEVVWPARPIRAGQGMKTIELRCAMRTGVREAAPGIA